MNGQASVEPKAIEGLTEGRIVHYVLLDGHNKGQHRPAVIVQVWDHGVGTSNLLVFRDGRNDAQSSDDTGLLMWTTSIMYSEGKEPGTWHFIERT